MKTPLLIISDAPSASSGLGRICRDLALGIHNTLSDIYDVGTMGYGGNGDRALPFPQYPIEGMRDWFIPTLKDVWYNFAGNRRGAVLTIWDASRLLWLARPDQKIFSPDREMREWLLTAPFQKWGYFPMDATGPKGMLCRSNAECLFGFDRILAYSDWAKTMIENTFSPDDCARRQLTAIPHGIHTTVFHPFSDSSKRNVFRSDLQFNGPIINDHEMIIGIVATNQTRKDYGLAFEALEEVSKEIPIRIFIQIDTLERHWSIPQLLCDFNLMHRTILNTALVSDEIMSKLYSSCDLMLGIGGGEGFGYPIFESLACGTPVITGQYGGQAEHMDKDFLMLPEMYRLEGAYNCVRPVYNPSKWAYRIKKYLAGVKTPARFRNMPSLLPERLDWKNLWPDEWEKWFRSQHQSLQESAPLRVVIPNNIAEKGMAPTVHGM
jgi:glycosyltransferase involved in cell wall biosynthesis